MQVTFCFLLAKQRFTLLDRKNAHREGVYTSLKLFLLGLTMDNRLIISPIFLISKHAAAVFESPNSHHYHILGRRQKSPVSAYHISWVS